MVSALCAAALALVAAACAAYGFKFVLSETKMRFHYLWFVLAAAFAVPAVLVATGLWSGVPAVLRWAAVGALAALAVYELALGSVIMRHARDEAPPGLDYVVVLGAQVLDVPRMV